MAAVIPRAAQLALLDVEDEQEAAPRDEGENRRLVQLQEDREERERAYNYRRSEGMEPRPETRSIPRARVRGKPALARGSIARGAVLSKRAGRAGR
jgi:hypothetical protein